MLFFAGIRVFSEHQFSAHDLNRVAAYAHVNHTVIASGSTNEDLAGSFHLKPLLDEHTLVRMGDPMSDHPRGSATSCRSGCRVLTVVEKHASVETGFWIDRLPGNEIKKLPSSAFKISAGT